MIQKSHARNGDLLSSCKSSTQKHGTRENDGGHGAESNPMQVHRTGFHNLWQTQRRKKNDMHNQR